ncbi:hypothetical protein SAMN06298216_1481 [Spirosomataceae bacterium TFI 002]|nr:hypothetical protein SAMN06298216_1481 [Spirosomataceae bacterium TFI 002]
MGNFKNKEEFKIYKSSLERRINELEESFNFGSSGLLSSLNPFKAKANNHVQSNFTPNIVTRQLSSLLLSKLLGKKYSFAVNALIPLAETSAAKAIEKIETNNILSNILDRVIYATELNPAEEQLLRAAEIEDEILEIEDKISGKLS